MHLKIFPHTTNKNLFTISYVDEILTLSGVKTTSIGKSTLLFIELCLFYNFRLSLPPRVINSMAAIA